MIRQDITSYVSDVVADLPGLQEVAADLRDTEPYVKEWLDRTLKQLLNNVCAKHNVRDKALRNTIHEELFRAFFMGFLAQRIEAENILKRALGIEYDPNRPGRPEKQAYHLWLDGMLPAEYYQENPSDYPEGHPYRDAYAAFQAKKELGEKGSSTGMEIIQRVIGSSTDMPVNNPAPSPMANAAGGDDLAS